MININKPTQIKATYKIVTPMFLGDAEKKATGISPQSFKGALRFWWRALAWGKIKTSHISDEEALKILHAKEAELFGSSANKPTSNNIYGKGQVVIKITQQPENSPPIDNWPTNNFSGYLAYGLLSDNNQAHRQAIKENQKFTVTFLLSNSISEKQREELKLACEMLGMFGGLGGRSRRALGSIQLTSWNDKIISPFENKNGYKTQADKLLAHCENIKIVDSPPYSAISKNSAIRCNNSNANNARNTHNSLGEIYKTYRKNRRVRDRKIFGLPLTKPDGSIDSRRASPVFFHIFEHKKGFGYSILYLPSSIFHHNHPATGNDWDIALGFLNQIGDNN